MRLYKTSASFTRPANTTAYTAGDLVANSTTAASVVPMIFAIPTQGFLPTSVKIEDANGDGSSTTIFSLMLYQYSPTPVNGDNGVYNTNDAGFLGSVIVDCTQYGVASTPLLSSTVSEGIASVDTNLLSIYPDDTAGIETTQIYGLLQAINSYTPNSGTTFTVTLRGVD